MLWKLITGDSPKDKIIPSFFLMGDIGTKLHVFTALEQLNR